MATITCYGGVNEIGGNKLLVDIEDTTLFLDFGYAFGAESRYFEEFLQPRTTTKLLDLIELDLIPPLDGVYRRDAIQPGGLDQLENNAAVNLWQSELQSYEAARDAGDPTPDGVFLSHAHLDHAGYIPFLGNIPTFCSPATETVLDALTDTMSLQGFDGDFLDLTRRELQSLSDRARFPGAPDVKTTDPIPRDVNPIAAPGRFDVNGVELEVFDIGHSLPGSLAVLVDGPDAQIVYTGDIRFHGRSGVDLGDELRGLRPDVLLCEGTRINEEEPDDEQRVEDEMTAVIEETSGLVMVGFAWKDLERYETVRRAAERAGRTPVFDPRLAYLKARFGESVYDEGSEVFLERTSGMVYSPADYQRTKYRASDIPQSAWDRSMSEADLTHIEKGTTALDIQRNPEEFVLQLDYWRIKNLVDLDPPPGSRYIRAQTEPFNDEMEISEDRLINWLAEYDINEANDNEPIQIHASGHASGPELQAMVDKIEPEVLIPIHTEDPYRFFNRAGRVDLPEKGTPIEI